MTGDDLIRDYQLRFSSLHEYETCWSGKTVNLHGKIEGRCAQRNENLAHKSITGKTRLTNEARSSLKSKKQFQRGHLSIPKNGMFHRVELTCIIQQDDKKEKTLLAIDAAKTK